MNAGATADAAEVLGTALALSRALGDPPAVAALRREAAERSGQLPLEPDPLFRTYGYFSSVDLSRIDAVPRGAAVPAPRAGLRTLQVVHDAAGSHWSRSDDLEDAAIEITPLEQIWDDGDAAAREFAAPRSPFTDRLSALSTALLNRGYRLRVSSADGPVRLRDVTVLSVPNEALAVRRAIEVAPQVRLLATEETFSYGAVPERQRLLASDTRLDVGERARVAYLTVHAPDARTVTIHQRHARVASDARLTWMWHGFGGFRTKLRNLTELPGRGADVEDLQTFFGDRQQQYDSGIQISHIGQDTHGQSVTRGLFRDEARGMSRGLVRIEPQARGTLSYLSEHAMLLSRGARSDTIPILEILCRDVKATHSSSVAPVDPEKVFYLESRGVPEKDSIRMIGEGFLANVLDRAPIVGLHDSLYPLLARRWDGREAIWTDDPFPSLPDLAVADAGAPTEWRFDAKLR